MLPKKYLWFALLLSLSAMAVCWANVELPAIISDNMVLQNECQVPIWGWADPGETVKVKGSWQWLGERVKADAHGHWKVCLELPDEVERGKSYELTVKGDNKIVIKNVLIGEVWVCSGQSNMEWPVSRSNDAEEEIKTANYPEIRLFTVTRNISTKPLNYCAGQWVVCSPETAAASAVQGKITDPRAVASKR